MTVHRLGAAAALVGVLGLPTPLSPQVADSRDATRAEVGAALYRACADCHGGGGSERAPGRVPLASMSPRAIVAALETGRMRAEGAAMSRDERVTLAEYLTGKRYTETLLPDAAYCAVRGFGPLDLAAVSAMGFGGDLEGTGYQPAARAGLSADDVPRLELKWAFAFPDASQARAKPTVVGDVLLVGGPFGEVLALEAETGCVRWSFEADAGIRGAVLVGPGPEDRAHAYFVDFRTNAYALDVSTGRVAWKERVGRHPDANATGSPALHDGRLFVPVSNMEVARAGDPAYECCTGSGAVAALDVRTGEELWYQRVIAEEPREVGRTPAGRRIFAPSGAPVWSSPTVDARRGLVYVGTGENYTRPTTETSDAILALDVQSGALAWAFQATEADAFTMACGSARNRDNCPTPPGPDLDFGMAPMLVTRPDGRQVLVAGQKSGVVWALDPDAEGALLWSTRVGKGSALGGIHWGMATDGRLAYAANADRNAVIVDVNPERGLTPGLYALDLMDGSVVWSAPAPTDTCAGRRGCYAANSAAPTAAPGVVFAGGLDGWVRAHAAEDGRLLWSYDTVRDFQAVGGVPARGGAIDGPGPVVAAGMVFVSSGYASFGQMAGNVLLAFGVG